MSETRATAPVFPPGRYGRRRDGRRRLLLPVTFGLVIGVLAVLLTIRLYGAYGDPNYKAQVVRWTDDRADRIVLDFTVRVPAGGSALCVLRALSFEKAELGRRQVTVTAASGATTIAASEAIPTTARAAAAEVVGCRAA